MEVHGYDLRDGLSRLGSGVWGNKREMPPPGFRELRGAHLPAQDEAAPPDAGPGGAAVRSGRCRAARQAPARMRSISKVCGAVSTGPESHVGHQVFAITNIALFGMPRRNSCITTPSTTKRTRLDDHSMR